MEKIRFAVCLGQTIWSWSAALGAMRELLAAMPRQIASDAADTDESAVTADLVQSYLVDLARDVEAGRPVALVPIVGCAYWLLWREMPRDAFEEVRFLLVASTADGHIRVGFSDEAEFETACARLAAGEAPEDVFPDTAKDNASEDVSVSEKILAAALLLESGLVVALPQPARHHHLFKAVLDATGEPADEVEQGFVTTSGRFVDRKTGLDIARAANQIVQKHGNDTLLFSEDMW